MNKNVLKQSIMDAISAIEHVDLTNQILHRKIGNVFIPNAYMEKKEFRESLFINS